MKKSRKILIERFCTRLKNLLAVCDAAGSPTIKKHSSEKMSTRCQKVNLSPPPPISALHSLDQVYHATEIEREVEVEREGERERERKRERDVMESGYIGDG